MLTASRADATPVVTVPPVAQGEDFTLDLRVTASAPAGAPARSDSDDGCSSTCELSNCVTASADPS
jgi:FxLD family lantipeptide